MPADAKRDRDEDLAFGAVVGEYRIGRKIGEGGFGAVYQAAHPLIGKLAAIKVLSRQYSANKGIVARFIDEARAVNQIRHRCIIDIFAFGQLDDGRCYYIMELLEGTPLSQLLSERGRLPAGEALPLLRQLARALDAVHAKGIAHRDLKPENIFVCRDDEGGVYPKLLDFGIAKLAGSTPGSHKTRTGAPLGTPTYMSPEQCRGRDVDHRTDIYSFGIVVFRTLTGKLPFDGDDFMDLMFKQVNEPAPLPSDVCADVPASMDEPIRAMLAKEADRRPANLADAVRALDSAASREGLVEVPLELPAATPMNLPPVHSETPTHFEIGSAPTIEQGALTVPGSKARGHQRKPVRWWPAVAAAAVAAVAGAILLWRPARPTPAAEPAPARAVEPAPAPVPDPAPAAPAPAPAVPETVWLQVDATPAGAEVYLDGVRLGTAPGKFQIPRRDVASPLELRLADHETWKGSVSGAADTVISATLERKRRAPVTPRPAAAKPATTPAPNPDKDRLEAPDWGK